MGGSPGHVRSPVRSAWASDLRREPQPGLGSLASTSEPISLGADVARAPGGAELSILEILGGAGIGYRVWADFPRLWGPGSWVLGPSQLVARRLTRAGLKDAGSWGWWGHLLSLAQSQGGRTCAAAWQVELAGLAARCQRPAFLIPRVMWEPAVWEQRTGWPTRPSDPTPL